MLCRGTRTPGGGQSSVRALRVGRRGDGCQADPTRAALGFPAAAQTDGVGRQWAHPSLGDGAPSQRDRAWAGWGSWTSGTAGAPVLCPPPFCAPPPPKQAQCGSGQAELVSVAAPPVLGSEAVLLSVLSLRVSQARFSARGVAYPRPPRPPSPRTWEETSGGPGLSQGACPPPLPAATRLHLPVCLSHARVCV